MTRKLPVKKLFNSFSSVLRKNEGFSVGTKLFKTLQPRTRRKFVAYIQIQVINGLLEIVGLFLLTILTAKVVLDVDEPFSQVFQKEQAKGFINELLEKLYSLESSYFSVILLIVLFTRFMLGIVFSRKAFLLLSGEVSRLSHDLFRDIQSMNYQSLKKIDFTRIRLAFSISLPNGILGILAIILNLTSDIILIFLILIVLIKVNVGITLILILFYTLFFITVNFVFGRRAQLASTQATLDIIRENQDIQGITDAFSENFLYNNSGVLENRYQNFKIESSLNRSRLLWLQQTPKYLFEFTTLLLTVSALIWTQQATSEHLIENLLIFVVSLARIAPSAQRISQGALAIRASLGACNEYFEIHDYVSIHQRESFEFPNVVRSNNENSEFFCVQNVSFKYPDTSYWAIDDVSFEVFQNEMIGLVGLSGSGKSTLMEILIGVTSPDRGEVRFHGLKLEQWQAKQMGKISYIPQTVKLVRGTILENILFNHENGRSNRDTEVLEVLEQSYLLDEIRALPEGLNTLIDPESPCLSGGQIQRLGIARALFQEPEIIFLDESTSALDYQSERFILETLKNVSKKCAIVSVIHKQEAMRFFDRIICIEEGKVVSDGTFIETFQLLKNQGVVT